MLQSIRQFFESLSAPASSGAGFEHSLQLATAVLLVEVMRSDAAITAPELSGVLASLKERFGLTEAEVSDLVATAEQTARDAHDLHAFTSTLNDQLDPPQKARIVEYLWQASYADGHLDAHEQHVMRKIADLLYIPQGDYIAAKMRARDAVPAAGEGPVRT